MLRLFRILFTMAFGLLVVPVAHSASLLQATSLGASAQVTSFDPQAAEFPRAFEVAGKGAVSLTPNWSVVGNAAYGFDRNYVRGFVGLDATASDANNPKFSVGLRAGRQFSSNDEVVGNEWAGGVAAGWMFSPKFVGGVDAAYGLDSNAARLTAVLTYVLKGVSQ